MNSRFLLWGLLSLPSWGLIEELYRYERYYAEIMYESGIWSIRFLVLTLAVSALLLLANRWQALRPVSRWFAMRRRYLGVAAFGYGALHTVFYIRDTGAFHLVIQEALRFDLAIGWIGIIIMAALALTSNNAAVRRMGSRWKRLQRGIYPAVPLIFLHWWLFDFTRDEVVGWSALLVVILMIRFSSNRLTMLKVGDPGHAQEPARAPSEMRL